MRNKRILSALLALLMVLSMLPTVFASKTAVADGIEARTLYLVPGVWDCEGARFAMYVNDNDGHEAWVSMTADGDGVFEADVPAGAWTNVIFCRMNGSTTENNWDNRHNQTADLFPAPDCDTYTITGWTDGNGHSPGKWSNKDAAGYYLVGNMTDWAPDTAYKLALIEDSNPAEYTITVDLAADAQFKVAYSADGKTINDSDWFPSGEGNNYGQNGELSGAGRYTVRFRPNRDGGDGWFEDCIRLNYTVRFVSNAEGNMETEYQVMSVPSGTKLTPPETDPTKDGYYFAGWYVRSNEWTWEYDENDGWKTIFDNNWVSLSEIVTGMRYSDYCMRKWSFNEDAVTEDTDLYAVWSYDEQFLPWIEAIPHEGGYVQMQKEPEGWAEPNVGNTTDGAGAAPGDTIYFRVTPKEGYRYAGAAAYKNGESYELTITPYDGVDNVYSFTMPMGLSIYDELKIEAHFEAVPTEPSCEKVSLTLDGSIAMNFYMDLSMLTEEEKAASCMTFTISGAGTVSADPVPFDATRKNNDGTLYGFSCRVNALQMADKVTATFHYGGNDREVKQYSVEEYIIAWDGLGETKQIELVGDDLRDKIDNLIHALADYGHHVQAFLADVNGLSLIGGETSNTAYGRMNTFYDGNYDYSGIIEALSNYVIDKDLYDDNITSVQFALVLDSETAIRVYFTPAEGFDGPVSMILDNAHETDLVRGSDGRYMVEITNIPAHKLGDKHKIMVYTGDNCFSSTTQGYTEVVVCAMSYVCALLTSDAYADNTEAKEAVSALYKYWEAAKEYLGN